MEQNKSQNPTIAPNPAPVQTPIQTPVKQTLAAAPSPGKMSCKYCKSPINENNYFCPTCGKKLKETPYKFSLLRTIGLILFSILLPPFGLIPGIKLLFKKEVAAKLVGIILIVISVVATLVITMYLINATNNMFKIYSDLNQMQGTPVDESGQELTPENVINQINALQEISR